MGRCPSLPVTQVRTRTARRESRIPRWAFKLFSPLALVALWQTLSATGVLSDDTLASPATVLETRCRAVRGRTAAGGHRGVAAARRRRLIALSVTFPLYMNIYGGIRNVDAGLMEAAKTLGLGPFAQVRHVILPAAMPNALVGELWQRHGCAILLVTHEVEEVLLPADRVLVMNEGRIGYDRVLDLPRPREVGEPGFVALHAELLARLGVE